MNEEKLLDALAFALEYQHSLDNVCQELSYANMYTIKEMQDELDELKKSMYKDTSITEQNN